MSASEHFVAARRLLTDPDILRGADAIDLPGLRVTATTNPVLAVAVHDDRGAVEVWRSGDVGAVRVHGRESRHGGREPRVDRCWVLGAPCWATVSRRQYRREFADLLGAGQHAAALHRLAEIHAAEFGGRP